MPKLFITMFLASVMPSNVPIKVFWRLDNLVLSSSAAVHAHLLVSLYLLVVVSSIKIHSNIFHKGCIIRL